MTTQDYLLIVEAASVTVGLITLIAWHIDRRSRRQPPIKTQPPKPNRQTLAEQAAETLEQRSKAHFAEMRRVCGIPPEGIPVPLSQLLPQERERLLVLKRNRGTLNQPPDNYEIWCAKNGIDQPYPDILGLTAEDERLYRNHLKQNPDWTY